MKTTKVTALIYCILCMATSLFAMRKATSTNELSALENIDKETTFETIEKPTKSTKTSKHRYSPRTSSPFASSTSASNIAADDIRDDVTSESTSPTPPLVLIPQPTGLTTIRSHRHSPRTPSPLAHSTSASDIAVDDIRDEIPSEPTSPTPPLLLIPQPTGLTTIRSHRHSPRVPSSLSHSSSASDLSDRPDTSTIEPGIRSTGISVFMSVINNFPRALTLQTTHMPLESDPNLLPLVYEIEIQPGSHEIKGLFRLKKYGYGANEVAHALTSIKFIDPTTETVLREITGNELRNSNEFFGIKLQPTKNKRRDAI